MAEHFHFAEMTTPAIPPVRDLAERLFAEEAAVAIRSQVSASVVCRICETPSSAMC